ncbi:MAG TPA: thioredoxin family protein [bacterium]|jgi:peroxiredoxin|nr:thioredoxin family protein [bacterium]
MTLDLGSPAPDFSLPGTDNKTWSLASFKDAKALCVVFSCNHCPYVKAYEGRFVALQAELGPRGFQLLAINSNDADSHPEDGFEAMQARAKEKGFNFPYLRDESQAVAHAFGAVRTPHVFLFDADRKLAYVGRIDDHWDQPDKVVRHELRDAVEDLLAGRPVAVPETFAVGCTIKWKED